jgi:twinkle protein
MAGWGCILANFIPDNIDFGQYLKETDAKTNVRAASAYIPGIKQRMRDMATERRLYMPWLKTRESFYYRPGEMSVYAGQNGHGKSLVTAQIALHLMAQGDKVCMASFEMKPVQTIRLMSRMFIGTNPFAQEYQNEEGYAELDKLFDKFGAWSDNKLWLYDQLGTTNPETVIGMTRYCAKELGIKHIFIDSLMKVVGDEDDLNAQKRLVGELFSLAKDHQVHIHLIHHLRKPKDEHQLPDKHDSKGSGSITDQPDNIFMFWRNKGKEEEQRTNGQFGQKADEPDSLLLCRKQRHYEGSGDGEPTIQLWLDKDSGQFVAHHGDAPTHYG